MYKSKKAGLVDILCDVNIVNVQGEDVEKRDVYANNQFMDVLQRGISCVGIASEELEDFVAFDDNAGNASKNQHSPFYVGSRLMTEELQNCIGLKEEKFNK